MALKELYLFFRNFALIFKGKSFQFTSFHPFSLFRQLPFCSRGRFLQHHLFSLFHCYYYSPQTFLRVSPSPFLHLLSSLATPHSGKKTLTSRALALLRHLLWGWSLACLPTSHPRVSGHKLIIFLPFALVNCAYLLT